MCFGHLTAVKPTGRSKECLAVSGFFTATAVKKSNGRHPVLNGTIEPHAVASKKRCSNKSRITEKE